VTLTEFTTLFHESPLENEEGVLRAFQAFDQAQTHLISVKDLRRLVTQVGDTLSIDEFNAFFSDASVDSEGNFDYQGWIFPPSLPSPNPLFVGLLLNLSFSS
jgi:Ca2+-binding EF-hand superfamily protein